MNTPSMPASLTVIVLAFNEELHLARCLESVAGLASRIVVVDSFSTDATASIAQAHGAQVVQRPFRNQAEQFQWALDSLAIDTDWILRLDADEYLEPALREELRGAMASSAADVCGLIMKRKVIFRGRWIRHGGYYPSRFLRAWRAGSARIEQRWMDEHTVLTRGRAVRLRNDFVDENLNDITWWTDKHNRFTTRQMVDFINLEYGLFPVDRRLQNDRNLQARFKRFLRNRVFGKAPLYIRAILYFLQRYFLGLGFLDGREGFAFHFLQGCWNWFLVDAKVDEARAYIGMHGLPAFKELLKSRHGIDVNV